MCGRLLSSQANLQSHREKYCRYREGKKARRPAVARERRVVEIDDGDIEFWGDGDEVYVVRTNVSVNGRVRDYTMIPTEDVVDPQLDLILEPHLPIESI